MNRRYRESSRLFVSVMKFMEISVQPRCVKQAMIPVRDVVLVYVYDWDLDE